jgi:hypothetical protein
MRLVIDKQPEGTRSPNLADAWRPCSVGPQLLKYVA